MPNSNAHIASEFVRIPSRSFGPVKVNGEEWNVPLACENMDLVTTLEKCYTFFLSENGIRSCLLSPPHPCGVLLRFGTKGGAAEALFWFQHVKNLTKVKSSHFSALSRIHTKSSGRYVHVDFVTEPTQTPLCDKAMLTGIESTLNLLKKDLGVEMEVMQVGKGYGGEGTIRNFVTKNVASVFVEATIPARLLRDGNTTAAQVAEMYAASLLIDTSASRAGASPNPHSSKVTAAIYTALRQNPMHLSQTSTCITDIHVLKDDHLYISCLMPSIIIEENTYTKSMIKNCNTSNNPSCSIEMVLASTVLIAQIESVLPLQD